MNTMTTPAGTMPGCVIKDTAMSKIDEAVEKIREAETEVYQLRLNSQDDLDKMRKYEAIEDKLHEALAALGQ